MAEARISRIADQVAANWFSRAQHANLPGDDAPVDLAEAYVIQAAVQERLSARRGARVGWKIALSSKAMQEMVCIAHPVAGAFFTNDLHPSPATLPMSAFRHLGIEFELAIRIARDARADETFDRETARPLVGSVHPAFELIEDRDADYTALDVRSMIADNAWCGGVVLGPEIAGGPDLDLNALEGLIREAGAPDETTSTGAADPLGSLAWVASHAAGQGTPLRAGDIVITGSAARTRFPGPGAEVHYTVAGAAVSLVLT